MGREKSKNPRKLDAEEFKKNVEQAMKNRANVLAPPPFDLEEFYASMYTPQEWDAIRTIHASPTASRLLFYSRTLEINTKDNLFPNSEDKHVRVMLHFGRALPNRDEVAWKKILPQYQKLIIEWAGPWQRYSQEAFGVCLAVSDLCDVCETPGQVARLWPNIVQFLPELNRDGLRTKRAKSPYPDCVVQEDGRLWEKYRPERFEKMDAILAETALLPAYDEERPYMDHNHNEINNDPFGY